MSLNSLLKLSALLTTFLVLAVAKKIYVGLFYLLYLPVLTLILSDLLTLCAVILFSNKAHSPQLSLLPPNLIFFANLLLPNIPFFPKTTDTILAPPPADGFILVAGKSPAVPAVPPSLPDSLPTFANKPAWEYVPPLPGKSNKREVEGRTLYWCTNHAKSPRCLTFVNTGQWVVHHPTQCRLKKPKPGPPSVTPAPSAVPPTVLVAALPAAPPVVPPPSSAGGSLSYSTVASGEPLLMRSKLKQILEGGDPTQVAGLFAAYQAACTLEDPNSGKSL